MKLVLTENIRGLGSTGDVVRVKDGYARNFLLPRKLALYPTEGNVRRFRKAREEYLIKEKDRIEAAELISKRFEGLELNVEMKANDAGQLFGSVTETILAETLSKAIGVEIPHQQIIMGSHWKRIGEYVRLHSEVEIEFPVHVLAESTVAAPVTAEELAAQLEAEEAEAAEAAPEGIAMADVDDDEA